MGNNMRTFKNEDKRASKRAREREREQVVATKRIAKATTGELDNYPQKTLCSVRKVCREF